MAIQTEKDLSDNARSLWLKALSAVELRNNGYAISLIQAVLKEAPGFLEGRKRLRKVEIQTASGKKSFLSGLSTASMKGASMVKKDPLGAMELAEKNLETDPTNSQANHLLKDAATAARFPETAAFALETLVEANPTDTKLMHELGDYYIGMGAPDLAVQIYARITEVNPSDLTAVKRGKDAAATHSMKSGGWETAKDYRDLIKNKEEAVSLEQKNRVVRSTEMIDQQLSELYAEWEQNQQNADLSRRMAKLYEDRFEIEQDAESIQNSVWYYARANELLSGSDPAVARKVTDLQMKQLDVRIKAHEDWLAEVGDQHDEAGRYRDDLAGLKREKSELLIADARRRIDRNPTDLQLRYELGEQLVNAGMHTEAIRELQQARQNPSARLKAMNLLGQCYTEKGMFDLAVKQFQDAAAEILAMDATKKDILYRLGLVLERMGKREESLKCMKEIYDADYGYMDVAERVEKSYGES